MISGMSLPKLSLALPRRPTPLSQNYSAPNQNTRQQVTVTKRKKTGQKMFEKKLNPYKYGISLPLH